MKIVYWGYIFYVSLATGLNSLPSWVNKALILSNLISSYLSCLILSYLILSVSLLVCLLVSPFMLLCSKPSTLGAATELQVIVVASCDTALYQASVLLCKNKPLSENGVFLTGSHSAESRQVITVITLILP